MENPDPDKNDIADTCETQNQDSGPQSCETQSSEPLKFYVFVIPADLTFTVPPPSAVTTAESENQDLGPEKLNELTVTLPPPSAVTTAESENQDSGPQKLNELTVTVPPPSAVTTAESEKQDLGPQSCGWPASASSGTGNTESDEVLKPNIAEVEEHPKDVHEEIVKSDQQKFLCDNSNPAHYSPDQDDLLESYDVISSGEYRNVMGINQSHGLESDGNVTCERSTQTYRHSTIIANSNLETDVLTNKEAMGSCSSSNCERKAGSDTVDKPPLNRSNSGAGFDTEHHEPRYNELSVDSDVHGLQQTMETQPNKQKLCPSLKPGIDLPEYVITFFKRHQHVIRKEIPGIELLEREDGTGYFQVTTKDCHHGQTDHPIYKLLSKLVFCQIPADAAQISFLDSHEGREQTQTIEESNLCTLRTHQPSVLFTATSPLGHRVCVCEGSIADNNCYVTVLPLHAEQTQWSPQIRLLLEKELMSGDIRGYSRTVGPPPKKGGAAFCCPGDRRRHVVVIHVSSRTDDRELDNTRDAIRNMMQKGMTEVSSIAVPYDLISESDQTRKVILRGILKTIDDVFQKKRLVCSLKLYLDGGYADSVVLCKEIDTLLQSLKWTCSGTHDFERHSVHIHVGSFMDIEADVIVNSANKKFDLEKGQVSKELLKAAGRELANQCKKRYPEGFKDHVVAVTDCFQLESFKKIFHIVLPHWKLEEDLPYSHLEWMRTRIQSCLALASAMKYNSIVFPQLGIGNLKYPPQEVAETMFSAFREFFNEMPHSSLCDVTVVCFHKNVDEFQTFKMVETRFALQQNAYSTSEIVFEVKGVKIHCICGNPQWRTCTAKFVVAGKQGLSGAGHAGRNEESRPKTFVVEESRLEEEFRRIFSAVDKKLMVPFCLQINMETFSPYSQEEVVTCVKKCLPETQNLKVVTIVVPTCRELKVIVDMFKQSSMSRLEVQTGFLALGWKSSSNSSGTEKKISVCGKLLSAERAVKEILQLPIPKHVHGAEYQQKQGHDVGQGRRPNKMEEGVEALEDDRRDTRNRSSVSANSSGSKVSASSREIDVLEYEALCHLLGQKFMDNFNVEEKGGGKTVITAKATNPPEELVTKMNEIRREDVQVGADCAALTFDSTAEGLDAYIKVLPSEGRVALFCFDYSTMTKAKHFVSVKTGKIKPTYRNRRKLDDAGGSRQREDKAPGLQPTQHAPAVPVDFTTEVGKIRVSVYMTDITKLPVDAIVNAANERLMHGGGVACAIARAAGFSLELEGDEYIKTYGPLEVMQVVATTGGALSCEKVLHAVGPRWADYEDKSKCCQDLTDTVFNCLALASKYGFTSVAVPSISSAIFGVPQQTCADCYLTAVKKFYDRHGRMTTLGQIHFVDVNDNMVRTIQETFSRKWSTYMLSPSFQPAYSDSLQQQTAEQATEEPSSASATRKSSSRRNAPAPSTERQRWPETAISQGNDDVSAGKQDGADNAGHHQHDGGVVQENPCTRDGCCESKAEVILSGRVHRVELPGLSVIFQQESIAYVEAEGIVLWQLNSKLFEDPDSLHIIRRGGTGFSSETVPTLKMELERRDGPVAYWLNSQLLICHRIASDTLDISDMRRYISSVLTEADHEKVESVAIPAFPEVFTSAKLRQGFADSLHEALSEYCKVADKRIRQVNIIISDAQDLQAVAEAFEGVKRSAVGARQGEAAHQSRSSDGDRRVTRSMSELHHNVCGICNRKPEDPWALSKCCHVFCTRCLKQHFVVEGKRSCLLCKTSYENKRSSQPKDGKMKMKLDKKITLAGFPLDTGTLVIEYNLRLKSGKARETAYLPNTKEGRKVLMLLKDAFDSGLVFHVGQSASTKKVGITWNDIPHKTDLTPGSEYGYPDDKYLPFVERILLEHGILDKNFTHTQRKFISDPKMFVGGLFSSDFSGQFNKDKEGTVVQMDINHTKYHT